MRHILKHIFIVFVFLFFIFSFVQAQNKYKSEDELKKNAQKLFDGDNFIQALPLYSQLLSLHPNASEYFYKYGVCLLYGDRRDPQKPIKYLETAARQQEANPEIFYHLGFAYHQNYRFSEAIDAYNKYKQKVPNDKKYNVDKQIEMCYNGLSLLNSIKDLYVLEKREVGVKDYYRSYNLQGFGGKLLAKPDEFKTKIDKKKKDNSIIFLSDSNNVIYFSSYGDDPSNKDIYRSVKKLDGTWGPREKLSSVINTPYDEDFPFLLPNGQVLYFCSKGHNSMGGYDIFKSVYDSVKQDWTTPVNLDFAINTPYDDILFVTDTNQQYAYFSSNRASVEGLITVYKVRMDVRPKEKFDIKIKPLASKMGEDTSYQRSLALLFKKSELNVNATSAMFKSDETDIIAKGNETDESSNKINKQADSLQYELKKSGEEANKFLTEANDLKTQADEFKLKATNTNEQNLKQQYLSKSKELEKKSKDLITKFDESIQKSQQLRTNLISATSIETKETTIVSSNENIKSNASADKNISSGKQKIDNGLTNDQILADVLEQSKKLAEETKSLEEKKDAAYDLVNLKKQEASSKYKEADDILANTDKISNANEKQDEISNSNKLKSEADQLEQESEIALEQAKEYEADYIQKQKESEESSAYAQEIQKAIETKSLDVSLVENSEKPKVKNTSDTAEIIDTSEENKINIAEKVRQYADSSLKESEMLNKYAALSLVSSDQKIKSAKTKFDEAKILSAEVDQMPDGAGKEENFKKANNLKTESTQLTIEAESDYNNSKLFEQKAIEKKNESNQRLKDANDIEQLVNSNKIDDADKKFKQIEISESKASTKKDYSEKILKLEQGNINIQENFQAQSINKTELESKISTIKSEEIESEKVKVVGLSAQNQMQEKFQKTIINENEVAQNINEKKSEKNNLDTLSANKSEQIEKKVNLTVQTQIQEKPQKTEEKGNEVSSNLNEENTKTTSTELSSNETGQGKTETSVKNLENAELINKKIYEENNEKINLIKTSTKKYSRQEMVNLTAKSKVLEDEANNYFNAARDFRKHADESNDLEKKEAFLEKANADEEIALGTQKRILFIFETKDTASSSTESPVTKTEILKSDQSFKDIKSDKKLEQTISKTDFNKMRPFDNDFKKFYNLSMTYIDKNQYNYAYRILKLLLKTDSANSNLNYYAGVCNLNLIANKAESQPYFEKASVNISEQYENNYQQKNSPIETFYYLGIIYQYEGDCQNATKQFVKFKSFINAQNENEYVDQLGNIKFLMELCNNKMLISSDSLAIVKAKEYKNLEKIEDKKLEIKNKDFKNYYKQAVQLMNSDEYDKALPILLGLRENDTTNSNINYLVGVCYYNLSTDKKNALYYLQSAELDVDPNYKSNYDQRKTPPSIYFYLGSIYQIQDDCENALFYYNTLKKYLSIKDQEIIKLNNKIELCNQTILRANKIKGENIKEKEKSDSLEVLTKKESEIQNVVETTPADGKTEDKQFVSDTAKQTFVTNTQLSKQPIIEIEKVQIKTEDTANIKRPVIVSENISEGIFIADIKNPEKFVSVYNKDNPIPVDMKVPEGLIFKVQIGAFKKPVPQDIFVGIKPIVGETTTLPGYTRYMAGNFIKIDDADNAMKTIKKIGYSDCFVVAYYNGKRITIDQAKIYMKGERKEIAKVTIKEEGAVNIKSEIQTPTKEITAHTNITDITSVKDIYYTVQVGYFKNNEFPEELNDVTPLYKEVLESGYKRYMSGLFANINDAVKACDRIKEAGHNDAFVAVYHNGQRISIKDATDLIQQGNSLISPADVKEINIAPRMMTVIDTSHKVETFEEIIPNNIKNIKGLYYSVQIGVFNNSVASEKLQNINPIFIDITANGLYKHLTGTYNFIEDAVTRRDEIVKTGINDAFVVAYYNGNRISLLDAEKLKKVEIPKEKNPVQPLVPVADTVKMKEQKQEQKNNNSEAIFYKVQIGIFNAEIPEEIQTFYKKILGENYESSQTVKGLIIYAKEIFYDFNSASEFKNKIANDGIENPFVVAFQGTKRISVDKARELLKK